MFDYTENPFEMKFNNRGRLSQKESQRMEYCLQAYHAEMIGINQTSKKTGIHPRTVSKYYKIFDDEIKKSEDSSFIELCKTTKNQRINAIDFDIINFTSDENTIAELIAIALSHNNVKEYVLLNGLLDKKVKSRQKLQDQKIELINTVTFDTDIVSEVKKFQQHTEDSSFIPISKDMIPEMNNFHDTPNDISFNLNYNENSHNFQNNLSETVICILNNSSNTTSNIKNNLNDNTNNYLDNDGTHNYTGRKLVP